MDFLEKLRDLIPVRLSALSVRKSLILRVKINTVDLETCIPKGVLRERSFWRTEKLDFFHKLADDSIKHTPGD